MRCPHDTVHSNNFNVCTKRRKKWQLNKWLTDRRTIYSYFTNYVVLFSAEILISKRLNVNSCLSRLVAGCGHWNFNTKLKNLFSVPNPPTGNFRKNYSTHSRHSALWIGYNNCNYGWIMAFKAHHTTLVCMWLCIWMIFIHPIPTKNISREKLLIHVHHHQLLPTSHACLSILLLGILRFNFFYRRDWSY